MAFWLVNDRRTQESSFIQRFDPRFWTVNFPRPAMASVITTGADSMQIDVELQHEGELVGLIWDSVDSLDHPLLAYETSRDYSKTTLSFRWQSEGIIPLNAANGPTLTIEGRDAAGTPSTWFVRLWNYASGSPTDAEIELPFSNLASGFTLPGSPIHAADIDRMFISLVAPDYVAGSTQPLSQRFNGKVTVSRITTDGLNGMLEIGDVRLPVHGERIATAYDDGYDQTPARLLRGLVGLGYREDIVHYVGMSHFMRLTYVNGDLLVVPNGELCQPAREWHANFFAAANANELELIASISYELFDAFCPDDWKQRTVNGDQALTGWIPPSTLLSPANSHAMAWLSASTQAFVGLLEEASQPVRFQIGEPWWWTTSEGEICLYDDAAKALFGGSPPEILDMRQPLKATEIALLDQAGELLAQSTADLTTDIRAAASGSTEVLLLAFTPTILDPQMPELFRANLPIGWAKPAFDRLQLEDYDWLTGGADALRRSAYIFANERLQYPIEEQDYLAGFVLDPADAETFWARIDAGLDEAATRGISRRYVWAQPQINRDGYTRLPPTGEDPMQAFDDVLYPFPLGRSTAVAPEFSTSVSVTASGHERRNSLWADARVHFDVGPGIRSESELSELIAFFRARRGAAKGFRISDPFDHSTNGMTGTPTMSDQLIGLGDGQSADFQLIKSYGSSEDPQQRSISRPRIETLLVSVDGNLVLDWTLSEQGLLTLAEAPAEGAEIRAGFLFDVPVRFAEDRIDISGVNFEAGEAPSIPLIELKEEL
ncbi:phage distal tail protein, Rcc01695 family [Erythrobacter sp. Alg231-14]|uniref:phage distal tail protein, Rcc01695 family n=1 Tax=Erythrobacter sp. Alg231-14 TaxID=1922225 RepID=UPI000D55465D